ncbi:MAG: 6-hydroxymethylpterin diphosphokinase MptE-like protein, partial [Chlamydiota bacterium]
MEFIKEPITHSDKYYDKNLAKFSLYDPLTAIRLSKYDFASYEYCYTHLGELNLCRDLNDETIYYHDMSGAYEEAKEWFKNKNLSDHRVVFLYGLGLGYYYETLKLWLQKSSQNRLIFFEDELGVIEKFLGTNLASEILDHPQVIIHYLDIYPTQNPQEAIGKSIGHLLRAYIRMKSFLGSTKLYTLRKEAICFWIRDVIFYLSSWNLVITNETLSKEAGILTNHYHNILRQYRSSNGHLFRGIFTNIPAIICGAGPSITNHIDLLKNIHDEAVLIGSGTGMNVLNYCGIIPHFGVGLDPTPSQETRIKTNHAYEVPFFYRPRFQKESFDLQHGPKLYIQGYPHNNLSGWFDQQNGLELEALPNQGVSSTNFSMQVARLMGCNPIILLGVDLAYVDSSRYPPIISAHPTDPPRAKEEISTQAEVPVYGVTNSGKDTVTKIEWFEEAKAIYSFKKMSPGIEVINCSEEGLAIREVPYVSFSEAKEQHLGKSYDINGRIHAQTMKTAPCVDKETGFYKIEEWNNSLHQCRESFREMTDELRNIWDRCLKGEKLKVAPYTGKIALLESELYDEPCYKDQIDDFINIVDDMAFDKKIKYRCYLDEDSGVKKELQKLEIDINYLVFFEDQIGYQDQHLKQIIDLYVKEEEALSEDHHLGVTHTSEVSLDEESYRIENGFIVIDDEEIGLKISAPFSPQMIPERVINLEKNDDYVKEIFMEYEEEPDGQYLCFNEECLLEGEMYYSNGILHGPSTFYSETGDILSRSWYINGKKEGKSWQRYDAEKLYSLQRFQNGVWNGLQEYFYKNGYLKSSLNYKNGELNGPVKLHYRNGFLKRELNFVDGKLDGIERYYAFNGKLIWEANYSASTPVGHARVWHSNGQLAREYEYSDDHTNYVLKEWNRNGKLVAKKVNLVENLQQVNERRHQALREAVGKFD